MVDPQVVYVIIVLVMLALVGINASRNASRRRWILKENLPPELKASRLVASEQYIETITPRKIHGTLDQLYLNADRFFVLVDSKTRSSSRVYLYDIIQLSVYKVILERNGRKMADYAYVRVVTETGVSYIKKDLLSEQEVVRRHDRTNLVLSSKVEPTIVKKKTMCNGCGQQPNCHAWQYDKNKSA